LTIQRCRAIAKTIIRPKALQVMSGVAVLIADSTPNECSAIESTWKTCNHSNTAAKAVAAVRAVVAAVDLAAVAAAAGSG
jgi:hypothetical protein